MQTITITLPDGKTLTVPKGSTALDVAKQISEGLARVTVVAQVDGLVRDAFLPLDQDCTVRLITLRDEQGVEVLRHSAAHVFAQALVRKYPQAHISIGPPIEHGFYYDVDIPGVTLRDEDLPSIEEEMRKVVKENHVVSRREVSKEEALVLFKDNPYKVELISEMQGIITVYTQGEFTDLCRGPHIPRTGMLEAFKLDKTAMAYWRGNANNKQLTRVYGVVFATKKELAEHFQMVEEAKKRDHKKIGAQMELYMIDEMIGKGLPVWLPKGEIIRKVIEDFAIAMEDKAGYVRVSTPHLAKEELFKTSGHLPHYEESMYPKMVMDDGTYYLKAMNCPLHHLVFRHKKRSYRELPMRVAEYGTVYRNELSGTLSGLLRVRMLSMNDAHIYCTKEQIGSEVKSVIEMIKAYFEVFGFAQYRFRLSLWDANKKDKYIDQSENWEYSQDVLRQILQELKVDFFEAEGEAAFYGPKIDIQFKTVLGREESLSTVQLDFLAAQRFGLSYADHHGRENKEVFVIHRAPLSTHERFIAYLIEHYAGKFPLWLSPEQVRILPVSDKFNDYAHAVALRMKEGGLRAVVDDRRESVSKKVRDAQLDYVNYSVVVGEKEEADGTVTVRNRENQVLGSQSVADFVRQMATEIQQKR